MNDHINRLGPPSSRNTLVPVGPTHLSPFGEVAYGPDPDLVDLKEIWFALWRNRYLIMVVVALFLAAGIIVTKLSTPLYQATARIEIDDQPTKVLGTEDYQPPLSSAAEADRFLQTQVDILHSRGLASRVVDSLNLAGSDHFFRAMNIEAEPSARRETAIGTLVEGIQVELPKNSRVVPISLESPDPKTASTIVNSYAENFIAANLQRRFDTSTYSKNFLQKQLELTKARLEGSERSLLAYARAAGIVDTSQGAGTPDNLGQNGPRSLTTSNLVQLNEAYAAARSARIQAQQRWQQAQSTPAMSLPDVLTNPAIQQLTQKRAELQADYQQQLEHRQPDYPTVKQAAAQLKELDAQIATIAGSIRNSIRNQYQTSARQEGALAGTVGQLKGATLSEQSRGIRYNILKREVDTNRELYDGLLQRYKEVSAQAGVTANNISIVDLAEPPSDPISPNGPMNLALAGVGGLVFALLLVLGREMFDNSIRTPDDVERRFGVPILGLVPKLGARTSVLGAISDERSLLAEPYQTVRAAIDLALPGGPPAAVLVTSGRTAEGKSTTAVSLARNSAAAGRKVLLIDGDMRRPSIHHMVGVGLEPGLAEALTGDASVEQAIKQTDVDSLFVLPAGRATGSPARLLSGNRFADLLDTVKGAFDQIVIDSPPVLGFADTLQMAAVIDQTILVVGCDKADRRAVKETVRRLTAARADLLGSILVKYAPNKMLDSAAYDYYDLEETPGLLGWQGEGGQKGGILAEIGTAFAHFWRVIRGASTSRADVTNESG